MHLDEQIAVNQFGQGGLLADDLLDKFSQLNENDQREWVLYISDLIWQSKPIDSDIEQAILESSLKPSYTPCVILRTHRLKIGLNQLIVLPFNELERVYRLLLFLFKQAYQRRYKAEKGDYKLEKDIPWPKWWYWDLSSSDAVESVKSLFI